MATHPSLLPWEIPWTEEPGKLQVHGIIQLDRIERTGTKTGNQKMSGLQKRQRTGRGHQEGTGCTFKQGGQDWSPKRGAKTREDENHTENSYPGSGGSDCQWPEAGTPECGREAWATTDQRNGGHRLLVRSERYGRPDQGPRQSFRVGCGMRGDLIRLML